MRRFFRSGSRGQSLVEFALILPVFLLVLMGILDLSRAVYYSSTLGNAARETARRGIVDQTCSNLTAVANEKTVGMENIGIKIEWRTAGSETLIGDCPYVSGETEADLHDVMHVTLTYDYTAATPVIGNIVGTVHMQGESKFPVEATCLDEATPTNCPAGQ